MRLHESCHRELHMCVCVCVLLRDISDPRGGPGAADSPSPAEQQVITGPNGLNKHDNGRSAVRQSEVRR